MLKKQLLTRRKVKEIKEKKSCSIGWEANWNEGIIIENNNLGVQIKYYGLFDENNNFAYDTVGISEREGNSIVIVTNQHDDIGLIHEYRPMPDKNFIACVRGCAENNELSNQTAIREMIEEVGETDITEIKHLNSIFQNSAFFVNSKNVFLIRVNCRPYIKPKKKFDSHEMIANFKFYKPDEILLMIKDKTIICQMTLSALMLYFSDKLME